MAINKIGLPLDAPSKQTVVPVVVGPDYNMIVGWLHITETTFDGTETEITLPSGVEIPLTTLTLPAQPFGDPELTRVRQYMAAVYPWLPFNSRPYAAPEFVSVDDSQYAMKWLMPVIGQQYRLSWGPLLTDLKWGMNESPGLPPTPPSPPDADDAALTWAVTIGLNQLTHECAYFDFNWVELFKTQSTKDPLKIEIVSNPAGGIFKSTIVAFPTVTPTGGTEYNTVRILKLHEATADDYVFTYKITDRAGQSVTATLTLTVTV
jgi:hypothetical protein